ncbi:MAG: NAD(P)/FAD-dependent oxidoreductase [Bdellovibrionales bacterium]
MSPQQFDVIIVGGGAIGAATLHFLAKNGITNTLLLEQRGRFARGATGAWGSLLRQFGALPFYNQLSPDAFHYYRHEFAEDTGVSPGFLTTGCLYFVRPKESPRFESRIAWLQRSTNCPIEILDAARGRLQFPEFQWFDDEVAVYEPLAGLICPYVVTEAWLESAKRRGARALTDRRVVEIRISNGRVTGVRCEEGSTFYCKELVLAAGPWTRSLLDSLKIETPLIVRPIQVNRFEFQKSYSEQQLPFFLDATEISFGRPMLDGSFLGGYMTDESVCTTGFRQPLSVRQAAEAKRKLAKRLKWLRTAALIGGVRALESYTPEEHPFLRYSESHPNLLVAAGWCCTGFALAPVFAQRIASLVQSRRVEPWPQTASL